jgi:tetratricopeptide (TPR) repeat protein
MDGTLNSALEGINAALRTNAAAEAMNASAELLTVYPMSVRAWRARAAGLEADGQFSQAADAYGRVLDVVPSDAAAMVAYARNLHAAGRAGEADEAARQALDYDPENALLRRYAHDGRGAQHLGTVGRVQFARTQFHAGLSNRAIAKLHGLLETQPTRIDAHVELADMLYRNSVRFTSAEICRQILASHPSCLIANAILMTHNQRTGNPDRAQQFAAVIDQIDPDHRETVALLGERSPVRIIEAPVHALSATIAPLEDEESRSDFVDQLIASASIAPAPVAPSRPLVGPGGVNPHVGVADPDTDENEALGNALGAALADDATTPAERESTAVFELPPLDWSGTEPTNTTVSEAVSDVLPVISRPNVTDEGVMVEPLAWAHAEVDGTALNEDTVTSALASDTFNGAVEDADFADEPIDLLELDEDKDPETPDDDDASALMLPDTVVKHAGDAPTDVAAKTATETADDEHGIVFGKSTRRPMLLDRTPVDAPQPTFIEHGQRMIRIDTMAPLVPKTAPRPKPADLLEAARAALSTANFAEATTLYKQLIAKGRLLDEIISDLSAATETHAQQHLLFEALGIAHTRKGNIPAAMTALHEAQRLAR